MGDESSSLLRIGIIGAGELAREVLERTGIACPPPELKVKYVAIADPAPDKPAIGTAGSIGLKVFSDYRALYDPELDIHLIFILSRDENIAKDVLKNKPEHIRVMTRPVFMQLFSSVRTEEDKWRVRSREMETILNGIQDFILVITPDQRITEVNEAFLVKMGYTRRQVIGRKCHEVFQKANQPCNSGKPFCPVKEAIRHKGPSQQIVTRVDHNGELRYNEVSIYPLFSVDGHVMKFIEVSRDITDKKKEQEEITRRLEKMVEERTKALEETHAKLMHSDKMASLGKLSASVVHEINNPIAGILNLILLMKRISGEGDPTPYEMRKFSHYLNLMETETRRISRIVFNLLTFSRHSRIELKKTNINKIIENTLFLNSNLLKINGVNVETELDPGLPEILGSEDHLQQVVMNLISNAAEALETKGGGTLAIRTKVVDGGKTICATFEDNGPGIAEEHLPSLFEPFFTTKKKGKGVGLGLSVVYGIVENHGGTIEVDSKEGGGTVFLVRLPLIGELKQDDGHGEVHGR